MSSRQATRVCVQAGVAWDRKARKPCVQVVPVLCHYAPTSNPIRMCARAHRVRACMHACVRVLCRELCGRSMWHLAAVKLPLHAKAAIEQDIRLGTR